MEAHDSSSWDMAKGHLRPARIHPEALRGAIEDISLLLALETFPEIEEPSLIEQIRALREPVAPAAILADLFRLIDVVPPAIVRQAVG